MQINMTLGQRDKYILNLRNEIKNKEKLLLLQKENIDNYILGNDLLLSLKNEYEEYFKNEILKKQNKIYGLEIIKNHINDLGYNNTNELAEINKEIKENKKSIELTISKL